MKTNLNIYKLVSIFFLLFLTSNVFSQEWEANDISLYGHSIDFINANTGFVSVTTLVNNVITYKIFKTIDKGVNFTQIYAQSLIHSGSYANTKGFSFDMITEQLGFVYIERAVYRTTNGGAVWEERCVVATDESYLPLIKFTNENIGFLSYTRNSSFTTSRNKIFKTTNGGSSWDSVFGSATAYSWTPVVKDITISNFNPNYIIMVGYYHNYQQQGQIRRYTLVSTNAGAGFSVEYDGGAYGTQFSSVQYFQGSASNYRIIGAENYGSGHSDNGTYCYTDYGASTKYRITTGTENIGGLSFVDANKGYAYVDNKLYKTTNSGVNWSDVYTFDQNSTEFNRNAITSFNDVVYVIDNVGKFVTHKLSTNLYTFFDNQSSSGTLFFDGTSYTTPSQEYLRGGLSSLLCSTIINSGQSNERIFYKWNDGYMYSDHVIGQSNGFDFYFDMSGTDIANYYKTKQLSTISSSISNVSQTKSVRDTTVNNITTTHTIHESMGGIFYSKSTNYGASYQTEEVVNLNKTLSGSDGNKNAYLTVMRASGGQYPITTFDANRNVAVVWEKYNSTTQQTEIKFAHRVLNTQQDGYEWETYDITSFSAPSGFESKPKCFVAVSPGQTQEGPFLIIVPHLRPNGSQNKIFTSVRYNSQSQDYELENGYIQDLAVASPFNYYSSYIVHFAYLKDDKVAYRREEFGYYNGNIYRGTSPPPEVNNNISSGDGYQSRYKPDISLMNGFPVVSYAANYNSIAWINYEGGETDFIQLNRYPIIKVNRLADTSWGNYVIYNSTNVQNNPDIEGSQNTKSYIINYSSGSGLFKKVANVEAHPGHFCDPNVFAGTDSRLIRNSYTGYFGSNMTLQTLSPNNGLYKLDKQNFNITNIVVNTDNVDNLVGVVNQETVSYSFNLGPILVKENNDDVKEITFGKDAEQTAPIVTPVEFNQNLRSNPFLLNESQALLVGCNVTYVKENSSAAINNVQYNVNLVNKSTGSQHRILYSDTIHIEDSIATEYLRGYYITNIPNGEDSFYVQISINNNDIADGSYYINPVYSDDAEPGDNSSGYTTKIIYENEDIPVSAVSIPTEYSLNQNYPNPFNPTTTISFAIPTDGRVKIIIYDITGKEIKALVNEFKQAGKYSVSFNGSNVASGIYFYKIETGSFVQTRKMSLIK